MSATRTTQELCAWLAGLPPDFAFLLALPFVLAAVGLLAEFGFRRRIGAKRRRRE